MQIKSAAEAGDVVMAVSGSVDAATVADFDAEWKKCLEDGAQKLIVDLSGVDYISSAGLRGILMLAKTAKAKAAKVGFAGASGMVADMFRLSGFLSILAVFPDKNSALAGL